MTLPLVPPYVNLRDFPYMPLDVVRLRDSDLVCRASGEAFRCAVLLWCAAWHQIPAASLPDDDVVLAQFAGFGRAVREFRKVKAQALRGFHVCSDGRLYHPTVAEKALEAWEERVKQRYRTECARIKKAAQRAGISPEYPTIEEFRVSLESLDGPPDSPEDGEGDVPGTSPGTGPKSPPGNGIQGKGREGKGIVIATDSPTHTPPAAPPGGGFEGHGDVAPPATSYSPAAPHAIALRKAGVAVTSMNPELLAYVAAGGTVEHVLEVAALHGSHGIGYVMTVARRELAQKPREVVTTDPTPIAAAGRKLDRGTSAILELENARRGLAQG